MRKFLLTTLVLGLLSPVYGQLYVSAFGGYGIPIMGHQLDMAINVSTTGFNVYHGMYESLGGGKTGGITTGYRFNNNLILSADFSSFSGEQMESGFVDSTAGFVIFTSSTKIQARGYRIIPNIGIWIERGKFRYQFDSGLLIGIKMRANVQVNREWPSLTTRFYEEELWGRISFGFQQKVSLSYCFNNNLALGIDVRGIFQSWTPKYGDVKKSENDGVNQLQNSPYSDSHYIYVEDMTQPNLTITDTDRREKMKIVLPLSSITFTAGVTYSFGKREKLVN